MSIQRELELQYQEIPRRREEILFCINNLREEAKAAEERFKHHEVEQKTRELELQQNQALRVKKEAQLLSIKNNKEYQATLAEIEGIDRKNARGEEKMIELMDQIEKERQALKQKRMELEEKETKFHSELNELDQKEKGLGGKVESARSKAESVIENVDPNLYRRFKIIFDSKGGKALATANGGYCGACNIRLTPRLIQLTTRGQDIVICEGCSRFLYWDHSLDEDRINDL
ncbi:MAG: hypothetical protein AB1656_23480 [Candidatus Omnitrophota bacterium]